MSVWPSLRASGEEALIGSSSSTHRRRDAATRKKDNRVARRRLRIPCRGWKRQDITLLGRPPWWCVRHLCWREERATFLKYTVKLTSLSVRVREQRFEPVEAGSFASTCRVSTARFREQVQCSRTCSRSPPHNFIIDSQNVCFGAVDRGRTVYFNRVWPQVVIYRVHGQTQVTLESGSRPTRVFDRASRSVVFV